MTEIDEHLKKIKHAAECLPAPHLTLSSESLQTLDAMLLNLACAVHDGMRAIMDEQIVRNRAKRPTVVKLELPTRKMTIDDLL